MRKNRQEPKDPYIVAYARLRPEDHAELVRREAATGAPISAQIRILVREALRGQKRRVQ